jgi:hypothetical protein
MQEVYKRRDGCRNAYVSLIVCEGKHFLTTVFRPTAQYVTYIHIYRRSYTDIISMCRKYLDAKHDYCDFENEFLVQSIMQMDTKLKFKYSFVIILKLTFRVNTNWTKTKAINFFFFLYPIIKCIFNYVISFTSFPLLAVELKTIFIRTHIQEYLHYFRTYERY